MAFDQKNNHLSKQISSIKAELAELTAKEQVISARKGVDPDRKDRERLGVLMEESAKLKQQLQEGIVNLVPPQDMPGLLKDLLTRQEKLELVSLENLAPQQLKFGQQESAEEFGPKLYRDWEFQIVVFKKGPSARKLYRVSKSESFNLRNEAVNYAGFVRCTVIDKKW